MVPRLEVVCLRPRSGAGTGTRPFDPRDLSRNELAVLSQRVLGAPSRVRHVPRVLLRALAPLHRQPRAALVMDTVDMTYERGPDSVTGSTDAEEALTRL